MNKSLKKIHSAGLRYSDKEINSVKTFLSNKPLALNSMIFLTNKNFSLLPFNVYRACLDSLIESKWPIVINEYVKTLNEHETLSSALDSFVFWCMYVNKLNRSERFYCTNEKSTFNGEHFEFYFRHNLGLSTKNFSIILFRSLEQSKFMKNYYIKDEKTLGIKSLSLMIEKL